MPVDPARGLEFFVESRQVTHTFSDAEIEILNKHLKEIEKTIKHLSEELKHETPSLQAISLYR